MYKSHRSSNIQGIKSFSRALLALIIIIITFSIATLVVVAEGAN